VKKKKESNRGNGKKQRKKNWLIEMIFFLSKNLPETWLLAKTPFNGGIVWFNSFNPI